MRLGDTKFFNLFALIATSSNPRRVDHWEADEVHWTRERCNHKGPHYVFQIELHTLRHRGRHRWTLLAAHETWWDGVRRDAFRDGRWIHLTEGARSDVIKWFSAREAALERKN